MIKNLSIPFQRISLQPGFIEFILAMLIAGSLGHFVVDAQQSAITIVFFRCFLGMIFLGIWAKSRGKLDGLKFTSRQLLLLLLSGVFLTLKWAFLFKAYDTISIGVATTLFQTNPILMLFISSIFLQEKHSIKAYMLSLLGFMGVVLIVQKNLGSGSLLSSASVLGISFALVASVIVSLNNLIVKYLHAIDPVVIALFQFIVGASFLGIFVDFGKVYSSPLAWNNLLIMGFFHTFIMYVLMYRGFRKLPLPTISCLSYIYPVAAITIDLYWHNVQMSPLEWLGVLFIAISNFGISMRSVK